jgi:hypothetical protein
MNSENLTNHPRDDKLVPMVIEVEAHDGTTAEAETPEAAMVAARRLWNEVAPARGCRHQVTVTVWSGERVVFRHTIMDERELG